MLLNVVRYGFKHLWHPSNFFFYEMDQLVRKTLIIGRDWKLRGQMKNAVRGREQKLQQ